MGAAGLLCDQRCFDHKVPFRLATEGATEQRRVNSDVLDRHLQRVCDILACAVRTLYRSPDLRLAVRDAGNGDERLHWRLHHMGRVIFGREYVFGVLECGVRVALIANDLAGLEPPLRTFPC